VERKEEKWTSLLSCP